MMSAKPFNRLSAAGGSGFGCPSFAFQAMADRQDSGRWLLATGYWLPGCMMLDAEPLNAEPWNPVADTCRRSRLKRSASGEH
jgi:hypothetical protein